MKLHAYTEKILEECQNSALWKYLICNFVYLKLLLQNFIPYEYTSTGCYQKNGPQIVPVSKIGTCK